ncbi:MAG: hypothetical protein K0R15_653 [Clostridiales bacterium]|nr:hypothetical protein [Clostridiales bacterium]
MDNDIIKDLKSSIGDYTHAGAKILMSAIPFVGGGAAELFNLVLSSPIEKRRDIWLLSIFNSLEELQKRMNSFKIEELVHNEIFVSTMMKASQLAIRTHQKEKLTALHNAVINTALNISIDESEQEMFLNILDSFTVWHLKIIHYFENPNLRFIEANITKPNIYMGAPITPLLHYYSDLREKKDFVNIVVKELYKNNILNIDNISGLMTEQGIYESRVTGYGRRFLQFINVEHKDLQ